MKDYKLQRLQFENYKLKCLLFSICNAINNESNCDLLDKLDMIETIKYGTLDYCNIKVALIKIKEGKLCKK